MSDNKPNEIASSDLRNSNKAGMGYRKHTTSQLTTSPYTADDANHIAQYNADFKEGEWPVNFDGDVFLLGKNFYNGSSSSSETDSLKSATTALHNKFIVFSLGAVEPNANENNNVYNYKNHFDITEQYPVDDKFQEIHEKVSEELGKTNKFADVKIKMPTAKNIIEHSTSGMSGDSIDTAANLDLTQRLPYSLNDFLYCKYYGKVPNTNLLTLRRFGQAVTDSACNVYKQPLLPIAQALTYFGDGTDNKLSDILNFNFGQNWKKIYAENQDVSGNEVGLGSGLEALGIAGKALSQVGFLIAYGQMSQTDSDGNQTDAANEAYEWWSRKGAVDSEYQKKLYGTEGAYWNRVLGPVNVINETHRRDRGLKFTNDMNIKFSYRLRMIDGVNPKVAMLDLITNFLALTYTNARFWGGMSRYFPNYPDYQAVPLMGQDDIFENDGTGDPTKRMSGYFDKLVDSISKGLSAATNGQSTITKKNIQESLDLENPSNILQSDVLKKISSAVTNKKEDALQLLMMNVASKSRPSKISVRNMLSGKPIGEWHLTIGNPMNPIAVMGNLIITDCSVTFGDTLGLDDFPTEVSFKVKLVHARPRDTSDIESMFNLGMGKMSYSPITTLPSEMNTFGESWDGSGNFDIKTESFAETEEEADGKKVKKVKFKGEDTGLTNNGKTSMVTNGVYDTSNFGSVYNKNTSEMGNEQAGEGYVKTRVSSDWGKKYSNSKNLAFLLNNTKLNF